MSDPVQRSDLVTSTAVPGDLYIDRAVEQVLRSAEFSRSEQLKRLLTYLLDAAKKGDSTLLSETAIGTNVFHRKEFNPKLDTIVRSEMVRVRRKLDEFYSTEGLEEPFRLTIDRNSYGLRLVPNPRRQPEKPASTPKKQFWVGLAAGTAAMGALASLAALLLIPRTRVESVPSAAANHPLWRGFHSAQVDVLEGSALFFQTNRGYERNWDINLPRDVPAAKSALADWPAFPVWDRWTAFEDIGAVVLLDRFLRGMDSHASLMAARQRSIGSLAGRRTIILGHPRFAPLLIELLADQDFRSPSTLDSSKSFSGFVNASPRPGELSRYAYKNYAPALDDARDKLISRINESDPDFGLISSLRLKDGGEVLSIFGDRPQSAGFLLRVLTEAPFLESLKARGFNPSGGNYRSAQIVVRVDYSKGTPTGVVYVTQRIRY